MGKGRNAKAGTVHSGDSSPQTRPRQGVMLLLAAGFVALFCERLSGQNFTAIWRGFRAVGVMQRVGALLATGCSFWAVGRYDAVEHRILATRTCEKQARRAGIAGIAISQTLGMGVFTGALVRWRMLPDVSPRQATRLPAAVVRSFHADRRCNGTIYSTIRPPQDDYD